MYIELDNEAIVPRRFLVCEFYGVETCFCWDADKLITFPYTKVGSAPRETRVLSTPGTVRTIRCYDGRVFLVCAPHGVYKLSRSSKFAVLSKNALAMGAEYWEVIVAHRDGVYLDNKQTKSSRLLFHCPAVSPGVINYRHDVHALSLNSANTETQFVNCLTTNWELVDGNLCVLAHDQKLFVLRGDVVQLVYVSDVAIANVAPVKRSDKVAGLLLHLVDAETVVLVHSRHRNLVFEKVYLGRNARNAPALSAGFDRRIDEVMWIVYCDQSRTYHVRKKLFTDAVQQTTRVDDRVFRCMQHYKADVILGLSQENELVELPLEELENSWSLGSDDVTLCTNMFQKTDLIMEKICARVKQLGVLYETLTDEQDRLRRVNLYALQQRVKVKPQLEVSRLGNCRYLILNICDKLPKRCHVVFALATGSRNIFCVKEVTDTTLTIKLPVQDSKTVLCSSSVSMDLITLMDERRPWCLIRDFINCLSQGSKRKGRPKGDKTVFIDSKITSLRNLIETKDPSMAKLCEIKKVVRAEL